MWFIITQVLIISLVTSLHIFAAPLASFKVCGEDLANTLSEVCRGRGYNGRGDFSTDIGGNWSDRRAKRGIVDDCCRKQCTWSTLEAYCSPGSSAPRSDNFSIRKRNGLTEKTRTMNLKPEIQQPPQHNFKEDITGLTSHHQRKLFSHNLSDQIRQKTNRRFSSTQQKPNDNQVILGPFINNKVKRNDNSLPAITPHDNKLLDSYAKSKSINKAIIDTEEILKRLTISKITKDRIRHPKTHSNRIHKLKGNSQIGTVSPYFLGRTLVLPASRKNRLP